MKVAVIGGTGQVGALVVEELRKRGDEVRIVTRRAPAALAAGVEHRRADLRSGEGLEDALNGIATVVDAVNDLRAANAVLVEGGHRVLAAEAAAGVGHHVAISIVGCDRTPLAYYRVKVAEEEVVRSGPVPWSMLRATQFHTLIDQLFRTTAKFRVLPRSRARFQPVDPAVAAARLADAVHAGPSEMLPELAGPHVHTLSELARMWREHHAGPFAPLPLAIPGPLGRALRSGTLTAPEAAGPGATFAEWLAQRPR